MNFKKKLLFTSCVVLSLQGLYASDRQWEEDSNKNEKSYNQPSRSNLPVIESEVRQEKRTHKKQVREPRNAFEVIDSIRQKKGHMSLYYAVDDVEEGLDLLHSYIVSGEENAAKEIKENDHLKKKVSKLEDDLKLQRLEYKHLIEEKNIIEKHKEEYLKKINGLQRDIDERDSRYNKLETNSENIKRELEYWKQENRKETLEYKEKQQDLKDQVKHLNEQLKEKADLLMKSQKSLNSVEGELSTLKKELSSKGLDIKEKDKEIISLKSSNKDLWESYHAIKREYDQLEQEKGLLYSQLMYVQGDLKEKEKFIQKGTNYVATLDKSKQVFQEKAKQKEFQLDNVEEKLKVFQDLSKQREEEILKKDEFIENLKGEISLKQERISTLEKENSVKDQIPLLRVNLITILSILGQPSNSDNLMELSTALMQAVISKINQK